MLNVFNKLFKPTAVRQQGITHSELDDSLLPWLDRKVFDIDAYVEPLGLDADAAEELTAQLHSWTNYGFAVIPQAIAGELIDALTKDIEEFLTRYQEFHTTVDSPVYRNKKINEVNPDDIDQYKSGQGNIHLRILDFIHNSVAAKQISLNPNITRFLEHVLSDRVVAFQSLNFFKGSEQPIHQDFAYVNTSPREKLVASWVALEDISPDAGPLEYIPGSHRLPRFDWGPGPFKVEGVQHNELQFRDHILAEAKKAGLSVATVCPKRGDAFIWHATLAHGGSPIKNPQLTRKSYVTHYGPATTHLSHVHSAGKPAERLEYAGGFAFVHPLYPAEENTLRNAELLG